MTRARYSGEFLSNQKGSGDRQHVEERGHHPLDEPDEKTAWVNDIRSRPVRKKTPSTRFKQ
jgi:hypothetical protein